MGESKWKQMAEDRTVLRCLVGSQAYGLGVSCPRVAQRIFCDECDYPRSEARYSNDLDQEGVPHLGSDRDEKGVCIEPISEAFPLNGEFEQYEFRTAAVRTGIKDAKSEPGDLDLTIYSLRKYLRLATYGNPNALELLFLEGDSRLVATATGFELQALAPYIVSRQAGRRYVGYMEAQKQRLLGERGQMRVTRIDLIEKFGYDTKYASHLVRLGFQGRELLETGKLVLPMTGDALDVTKVIKMGGWSLDAVLQVTRNLETQIKDLVKDGPLQDTPDYQVVEEWMREVYWQAWKHDRKPPIHELTVKAKSCE